MISELLQKNNTKYLVKDLCEQISETVLVCKQSKELLASSDFKEVLDVTLPFGCSTPQK